MDISARKLTIVERLFQVKDERLLAAVEHLLDFGLDKAATVTTDLENDLTPYQKERIRLSIKQLDEGLGIPHEEVMAEFRNKYKRG